MRVTVQHSAYNAHLGAAGSEIIPEDKRASIMNIFRIPLNAIVVIALLNIKSMTNSQVGRPRAAGRAVCHTVGSPRSSATRFRCADA